MATVANDDPIGNGQHFAIPVDAVLLPPEADALFDDWAGDNDNLGLLQYELGHDSPPPEPRLSFDTYLDVQASMYRSQEGSAAKWLAGEIAELAKHVRRLRATCPGQFDVKRDLEHHDRDARLKTQGWEAGLQSIDPVPYRFSQDRIDDMAEGRRRDAEWRQRLGLISLDLAVKLQGPLG